MHGCETPSPVHMYTFKHLYLCECNYVHMGRGAWQCLAARVGPVSTFCPSVPFLPARPGAPWRRKKKGRLVPILVHCEQQGRERSSFPAYLPAI